MVIHAKMADNMPDHFKELGKFSAKASSYRHSKDMLEVNLTIYESPQAGQGAGGEYAAQIELCKAPEWIYSKRGPSVEAYYEPRSLPELFGRLKAAESGFEEILNPDHRTNAPWREHRSVMKCILSLEDQVTKFVEEKSKKSISK